MPGAGGAVVAVSVAAFDAFIDAFSLEFEVVINAVSASSAVDVVEAAGRVSIGAESSVGDKERKRLLSEGSKNLSNVEFVVVIAAVGHGVSQ